jgi:hypothetical protein
MELERITNEDLTRVVALLKIHVPNWPILMSERMHSDKEWQAVYGERKVPKSAVYNISSGMVQKQFKRRIFAKCATALLGSVALATAKISDGMEQLLETNSTVAA